MATNDLLSLAEGKTALNITTADQDSELPGYITAVSQRIDDLCCPVVLRTITDELHDGGGWAVLLRFAPASLTSATTISTVTEYSSGVAQVLTAEALTTSTAYDFFFDQRTGILYRRSGWSNACFAAQRVKVTYSAGRYASTAAVDEKFKAAARTFLQHLWRPEQGTSSVMFPADLPAPDTGVPGFGVPNVVKDMLADEIQYEGVA